MVALFNQIITIDKSYAFFPLDGATHLFLITIVINIEQLMSLIT